MSNYPPPGMSPTAYQPAPPPPPQPSGCGCGGCLGKFFILLGVAFFLMLAVCCGGGYYLIKNSVTTKADEVIAMRDDIASMNVPQPLQPMFAARFKSIGGGKTVFQEVMFAAPNKKAILSVTTFSDSLSPQFKDILKGVVESGQQSSNAGKNGGDEELKDVKETTIERKIGGETAKFRITEGVGVTSGKKKIAVQGAFQSKSGPAIFVVGADEATLSRKQVEDIIQSIDAGANDENKDDKE